MGQIAVLSASISFAMSVIVMFLMGYLGLGEQVLGVEKHEPVKIAIVDMQKITTEVAKDLSNLGDQSGLERFQKIIKEGSETLKQEGYIVFSRGNVLAYPDNHFYIYDATDDILAKVKKEL